MQDDPHANIVINKAIPKFADELVYSGGDRMDLGNGKQRKRKSLGDFSLMIGDNASKF